MFEKYQLNFEHVYQVKLFRHVISSFTQIKWVNELLKLFSLVVNTSSSHEPGDHWLALVYRNNVYYFLDSYGRDITDITFPEEFKEAIKRYVGGEKILYNRKILQQILSNACGDYAIYFVRMFSSGDSLKKSLTVFTDNLKYNDVYVTNFVKHLMN